MAERKFVLQNKGFAFNGLFDMKGLFRVIQKWFTDQGYNIAEIKNSEEINEDSKKITIVLLASKTISDYMKFDINLSISGNNLKDVDLEVEGVKHKLLRGDLNLSMDGSIVTDYENRWEGKAPRFFFRVLIDKFIYKSNTDQGEIQIIKDMNAAEQEFKSFLNMFRYVV